MRRALCSGDPVRRRLSSEQACNISRKGSCQLSDINEELIPPDILLHIASQEGPEGSGDAYSGPWASCNVLASHSEEQLAEVTSPRKGQLLCTELSSRHDELNNLLSRRNCLNQEGCTLDTGAYNPHSARDPLPSARQVSARTHDALADAPVPLTQGAVQAAMQQAVPMMADLRKSPEQHASATHNERSRQAQTKAEQTASGIRDMDSCTRVFERGVGALGRPEAQHENKAPRPVLLHSLRPDLVTPRSAQQQPQPHSSMQFPWLENERGHLAMCSTPSMQQPELPLASRADQQESQRPSEPHHAQAEGAVRSARGRSGQTLPDAHATDASRPTVKQGRRQSPQDATRAGLARLAYATSVPLTGQQSDASCGLAPDREARPSHVAQRPSHVVPLGTVGMHPLIARPRSACSPIAAAMQYPPDNTPPPAWGNSF